MATMVVGQIQGLSDAEAATVLLVGKIGSALVLVVLLAIIVDIWRRPSFPAVSYGSIELSHKRMRWLWMLFVLAGGALGDAENPLVVHPGGFENAELLAEADAIRNVGLDMPFPAYRLERQRRYVGDELAAETTRESVYVPWELLSSFFAYFILVIRWNPESRLALRILQGRRRKWFRR